MFESDHGKFPNFTIHLSTSDLVSMLVVDSESLSSEFHEPGYYDENGDYFPQYCDDPDAVPGALRANDGIGAGTGSENDTSPAEPSPSSEPSKPDE